MEYIVGAYATAPSAEGWDPELESLYYQHLKSEDNIIGIEHPFVGKLHPYDDEWFLSNVSKDWQFVFTSIPGVMGQLANNPHFGIASTNEAGRQAALVFYLQAQQAIMTLNNHLGREAVSFLKIHTAPKISKNSTSSVTALQSSLETMLSWDWHGAKLVIEHCDAYIEGQDAEKGFMRLEDEISAAQYVNNKLNSDIGISINWGRSAIETRSTNGPLQHIELAKQSGLLKGIIFSGASDIEGPYGKWKDTHMPPAQDLNIPSYAQGSLLTFDQMVNAIQACQLHKLAFLGGKISLQPNRGNVSLRISYIKSLLVLLDHALETTSANMT